MELAALASAAVPALALTGVAGSPDDVADFDSALLVDDAGKQWRVRSPKHVEASMRLETELLVLRAFVPAVRAELPFALPYVAGTVRQGDLCTFVYSHLAGTTQDIDDLAAGGKELAADIGRTMAAVHALPQALVNNADLPSYTANEFRQRKLNELDQAATTGKIPATLLRRWEHALEDVGLWRFSPTVVHGDLHEDNLLISGNRVTAVSGWTDLRIGDPADDFAWLIAANNSAFTDAVHAAYVSARPDAVDPHLIRRAALSAEFALAQWLVRGMAAQNQDMISEAEEMLATLEADILEQEAALAAASASEPAGESPSATSPATSGARSAATAPGVQGPGPQKPAQPSGIKSSSGTKPSGAKVGPKAEAKVSVLPLNEPEAAEDSPQDDAGAGTSKAGASAAGAPDGGAPDGDAAGEHEPETATTAIPLAGAKDQAAAASGVPGSSAATKSSGAKTLSAAKDPAQVSAHPQAATPEHDAAPDPA